MGYETICIGNVNQTYEVKFILPDGIGATNVALAEYESAARGSLTLLRYGVAQLAAPIDGGNAETILAPALLEIVRTTGIRPGKVSLALSGQMVFPKFAAVPMAGGAEKFEQMVRNEIEQNIPFPIDEMVCDRQVLGDTEGGDKSVMIVAAKVDQVEDVCGAVASAGFSPELVDVAPIALTNAVRAARPDDADSCLVILDIGARTTSLVIVEGDKLYNRSIPVAGNAITKEISAALGCSLEEAELVKFEKGYVSVGGVTEDEDEVADRVSKVCRAVMTRINAEVSRSINFYRSQQQGGVPAKLYLTGGTSLLPQTDQFFAESLGIEVELFNPFETIAAGPAVDADALGTDAALLGVTAGLAQREAGAARFEINLLPPSIVSARAEKARIPVLAAGGAMIVVALVLVMLAFNREAAEISARRDAVAARISSLSSFDSKVTAASRAAASAQADAERLRATLLERSRAMHRLNVVRASLLDGMWIESWKDGRITVRAWIDRVKGKSPAGKTTGEYVVDRLKAKGVADEVKILDISRIGAVKGGDGQIEQFTLEVKFK
ncbi:MAG: type IV pilus assembly protein PilM [Kiritimatiellae bacterium]|nr:type IV pilus assembly protein PilM [Kiritimatiellia bacterium]